MRYGGRKSGLTQAFANVPRNANRPVSPSGAPKCDSHIRFTIFAVARENGFKQCRDLIDNRFVEWIAGNIGRHFLIQPGEIF